MLGARFLSDPHNAIIGNAVDFVVHSPDTCDEHNLNAIHRQRRWAAAAASRRKTATPTPTELTVDQAPLLLLEGEAR